jgi:hypothetical protein
MTVVGVVWQVEFDVIEHGHALYFILYHKFTHFFSWHQEQGVL